MAHCPDSYIHSSDVVQEVIRKPLEVTAAKSAPIKMKPTGILGNPANPNSKFRKEILTEPNRNLRIPLQDFIQILLNPLVESNFHAAEVRRQVRRK